MKKRTSLRNSLKRLGSSVGRMMGGSDRSLNLGMMNYRGIALEKLCEVYEEIMTEVKDVYVVNKAWNEDGFVEAETAVEVLESLDREFCLVRIPQGGPGGNDRMVRMAKKHLVVKPKNAWTMQDVCDFYVLPRTMDSDSTMASQVPSHCIGKPYQGAFLSCPRSCTLVKVMESLLFHFANQERESVFIWLDVFCANQPLMKKGQMNIVDQDLHRAIDQFEQRLVYFDHPQRPTALQRAWCVWEMYGMAQNEKKSMQVVYDRDFAENFLINILDRGCTPEFLPDLNKLEASNPTELKIILLAMQYLPGKYGQVKVVIREKLTRFLVEMIDNHLGVFRQQCEKKGDQATLADVLTQVGLLVQNGLGKTQLALQYFEQARVVFESNSRDMRQHTSDSQLVMYHNMSRAYMKRENYDLAVEMFLQILSIKSQKFGADHPEVALVNEQVARIYKKQHKFEESIKMFRKSLVIYMHHFGEDDPHVANVYGSIGEVYQHQGKYKSAIKFYEMALVIKQKVLGPIHRDLADIYFTLGNVLECDERLEESLTVYLKALRIALETLGERHPDVADIYFSMGHVLETLEKFQDSLNMYENCLAIYLEAYGNQDKNVADTCCNIAKVLFQMGKFHDAIAMFERSLPIYAANPKYAPKVAQLNKNLALVYETKKQYKKAAKYAEKSFQLHETLYGASDVKTMEARTKLAQLRQAR